MFDFNVKVDYAKEGTDERHKSSGIRFTFRDAVAMNFMGKYVAPLGLESRLYFDVRENRTKRGEFNKVVPQSKNCMSSARVKKVTNDTDFLRSIVPFVGEHNINYDPDMKLYYISADAELEDTSLPLFMLPKKNKETEERPLSDRISTVLINAGMGDKITDNKGETKVLEIGRAHV